MRMAQHVAAWAKSGEPEPGFVPVEYVSFDNDESRECPYFDLEYIPPKDVRIKLEVRSLVPAIATSGGCCLFRTNSNNVTPWSFMLRVLSGVDKIRYYFGDSYSQFDSGDTRNAFHVYEIDTKHGDVYKDGNLIGSSVMVYPSSMIGLTIGKRNGTGTNGLNYGFEMKRFTVVDENGNVLREIVPYRDKNYNAFLFDGTKYYSVLQGSDLIGDVSVGPDKT